MGRQRFEDLDFGLLTSEIKKLHDKEMAQLIEKRWAAIKSYFEDELDTCDTILENAYQVACSSNYENWIANDILIDRRNIHSLLDDVKSQITNPNEIQKLIDNRQDSIFYPLIDRFESSLNEDVLKELFRHKTASPYTTLFGGLDAVFDNIVNIFIISTIYGSLTHVLLVRERLAKILSSLCFIYNNHSIYIEMLNSYILCQKDKEIEQVTRKYNQNTEMINEIDSEKIYNNIATIPISHKRLISKLIAFEHLGYYFPDELFSSISFELLCEIDKWIQNEERVFRVSEYIFKAINKNIRRLENDRIAELVLNYFKMSLKRWYDNVLETISLLDFSQVEEGIALEIIKNLIQIISDEKTRGICRNLKKAIINTRLNCSLKHSEIDKCVEKHWGEFYKASYTLSVFDIDEPESLLQIEKLVKEICEHNETQGKNGTYKVWSEGAYKIIESIIEYGDLKLDWTTISLIINAIEGTVFCESSDDTCKNLCYSIINIFK